MRCRGDRRRQHFIRQPSDITVRVQLAPCPSFIAAVVDRHAFALERLRYLFGLKGGRRPHRRNAVDNNEFPAFDKTRGLDLAFKIFRGEVGPRRRQP